MNLKTEMTHHESARIDTNRQYNGEFFSVTAFGFGSHSADEFLVFVKRSSLVYIREDSWFHSRIYYSEYLKDSDIAASI